MLLCKKARNWFLLVCTSLVLFACGAHVHHQVKKGETLYSIGWRYDQNPRDLAKWNKIKPPYIIHEGEWIRVAPPVDAWPGKTLASNNQKSQQRPSPKNKQRSSKSSRKIISKTNQKKRTENLPAIDWQWPAKGKVTRNSSTIIAKNKGIDILGKRGQTIYAAANGKVVYSGSGLIGYGKLIIIKHNKNYLSAYAHNDRILVAEGQHVKAGQQIAEMGLTGTGQALLYFEIRHDGQPVDAMRFLAGK